jgi:hypothetical protein
MNLGGSLAKKAFRAKRIPSPCPLPRGEGAEKPVGVLGKDQADRGELEGG